MHILQSLWTIIRGLILAEMTSWQRGYMWPVTYSIIYLSVLVWFLRVFFSYQNENLPKSSYFFLRQVMNVNWFSLGFKFPLRSQWIRNALHTKFVSNKITGTGKRFKFFIVKAKLYGSSPQTSRSTNSLKIEIPSFNVSWTLDSSSFAILNKRR